MVTGRFSHRIYIAYSTLYCVGTILSMQISFVGFQPVQSSEHMLVRKKSLKLMKIIFNHF
jgi:dolichyl-diphosphooligosaccharide--protein glycosyltransferase